MRYVSASTIMSAAIWARVLFRWIRLRQMQESIKCIRYMDSRADEMHECFDRGRTFSFTQFVTAGSPHVKSGEL